MKTKQKLTNLQRDFLELAKKYLITGDSMSIQFNRVQLTATQLQTQTSYVYQLIQDGRKMIYSEEEEFL